MKTTNHKGFIVKPNTDYINNHSSKEISIEATTLANLDDKFLLQIVIGEKES